MKNKTIISSIFSYLLVVVCFLAISSNLHSFYYGSKIKEDIKVASTDDQSQEEDDEKNEQRYFAYEAVVPVVHFSIIFQFFSVIKVELADTPPQVIKQSPPALFTRPFYRTLFRMIISPNAP